VKIACSCGIDDEFLEKHTLRNESHAGVESLADAAKELLSVAELLVGEPVIDYSKYLNHTPSMGGEYYAS